MAWDAAFRLPQCEFFSPVQMSQIEAFFLAIQTRDRSRGIPGSDDCGAARFLDLLLQRPAVGGDVKIHDDLGAWQESYPVWLEKLDQAAMTLFGAALEALPEENVTALLRQLEQRQIASFGTGAEQQAAFDTIWRHCLQGCWSDPRWGGNRDRIMWRWLGYLQEAEPVQLA